MLQNTKYGGQHWWSEASEVGDEGREPARHDHVGPGGLCRGLFSGKGEIQGNFEEIGLAFRTFVHLPSRK